MAENLRYAAIGSACPDSSLDSCARYGKLYRWWTAMGLDSTWERGFWPASSPSQQGVCPAGWHVPTQSEWDAAANWMKAQLGADSTQFLRSLHAYTGYADRLGIEDRFGFRFLLRSWGSQREGWMWLATNDEYSSYARDFGITESLDVLTSVYSKLWKGAQGFVRCRIND